ncbi:PTS sugar transporter subunit IIA [Companilactobacillus paralimentarius]|uniref:PTS sugar transporter subunit IIA n=1 Tax=Companilactobacillus paralimentarius TaxID=83526 RepID=UPI00384C1397
MQLNVFFTEGNNDINIYSDAITTAGSVMVKNKAIVSDYINACIDRETDFPTGLLLASGKGVAMPHGNSNFVKENSISIVRLKKAVQFGRMEDKSQKVDCSLIFNLALTSGDNHIKILKTLVLLFQDTDFIKKCETLSAEQLTSYVKSLVAKE